MEAEPSKARNSRTKRKERAHQLNQEKQNLAGEGLSGDEGEEGSSPRCSKDRIRSKHRRQRNNSTYSCDEDIIDGFAIVSFRTVEDLENGGKNKGSNARPRKCDSRRSSPSTDGDRSKEKEARNKSKKGIKKHASKSPSPGGSPRSLLLLEERTKNQDSASHRINTGHCSLPRCGSRDRFSDASTHSSSGQGYVCDIESGDEKASESGSDLFSSVSNCQNRLVNHVRPVVAVSPPSVLPPTTNSVCNGLVPTVTVSPTTTTTTTPIATVTANTVTTITPTPIIPTIINTTAPVSSSSSLPSTLPPSTALPPSALPPSAAQRNIPTAAATPIRRPTPGSPLSHKQPSLSSSINSHHSKPRQPPITAPNPAPPKPPTPISRTPHRDQHQHYSSSRDRERENDCATVQSRHSGHLPVSAYPPSLPFSKPLWSSGPSLYHSPHTHLPPSPLHTLHPTPSFPHHSLQTHLSHVPPSHSHPVVVPSSHGMFAPPLPPGPSALSTGLPSAHTSSLAAADLLRGQQDYLHQDLTNRLLAQRGADTAPLPPSPFLRTAAEAVAHGHQLHSPQHMHPHSSFNGLGQPSSLVPTPPPHLFDKVPKSPFESALYRPGLLPGYSPAFASLLPGGSGSMSSSLQGAFQPKVSSVSNMGPVPGRLHDAGLPPKSLLAPSQMLLPSFRDRDKLTTTPIPPAVPVQPKKQGKWCAVHVRIAWEIYRHQQQKGQDIVSSASVKPLEKSSIGDPLRPPNHLLPRPPDLPVSSTLLPAGAGRLDGLPPHSMSLFSPAGPLGLSSFPRPAPYPPSMLGLSHFGGLANPLLRDLPAASLASPHDWNRLHRTPPSFPVWPKTDMDRDKEKERETEREREREQREKDRKEDDRDRCHRLDDRGRYRDTDLVRSRSRSPLRNGTLDRSKDLSVSLERRLDEKGSGVKVKDEQRGREEDLMTMEREKHRELLQNSYLSGLSNHGVTPHPASHSFGLGLLDRTRLGPPHPNPYMSSLDPRLSAPAPSLWSFDKASELSHRLELERVERERLAVFSRLTAPVSLLDQERRFLQEQQDLELRRGHYFSSYDRERMMAYEKMRSESLVAAASTLNPFSRTISPMFNHLASASKTASPATMPPTIPPALIPTAVATAPPSATRSHDNSPSSSKTKGYSAADSTSDLKDKRDSVSADSDSHTVR